RAKRPKRNQIMNTSNMNPIDHLPMKRSLLTFVARILPALLLLLVVQTSQAGSATWDLNPTSGDWTTNANWTPDTGYPGISGISDVATFDVSNTTAISIPFNVDVAEIVFNSNASAFTITVNSSATLTLSSTGMTNNSGVTQNFVANAAIEFDNSATAGSNTSFTNNVSGFISFHQNSTAGSGAFTNNGAVVTFGASAATDFFDTSTAGSGTFTNNGGAVSGAGGGGTQFITTSTAGSAILIANGGTGVGGTILFFDDSTGGTTRMEVFNNGTGTPGNLDIS